MSLPTDDEIRAAGGELGLLDEHGQVPRELRTRLAAVAVQMRGVPDDGEPEQLTTAQALSRLYDDLADEGFGNPDLIAPILGAAASSLIARDGLILKENRTS